MLQGAIFSYKMFEKKEILTLGLFCAVYVSWGLTDSIQVIILWSHNYYSDYYVLSSKPQPVDIRVERTTRSGKTREPEKDHTGHSQTSEAHGVTPWIFFSKPENPRTFCLPKDQKSSIRSFTRRDKVD